MGYSFFLPRARRPERGTDRTCRAAGETAECPGGRGADTKVRAAVRHGDNAVDRRANSPAGRQVALVGKTATGQNRAAHTVAAAGFPSWAWWSRDWVTRQAARGASLRNFLSARLSMDELSGRVCACATRRVNRQGRRDGRREIVCQSRYGGLHQGNQAPRAPSLHSVAPGVLPGTTRPVCATCAESRRTGFSLRRRCCLLQVEASAWTYTISA